MRCPFLATASRTRRDRSARRSLAGSRERWCPEFGERGGLSLRKLARRSRNQNNPQYRYTVVDTARFCLCLACRPACRAQDATIPEPRVIFHSPPPPPRPHLPGLTPLPPTTRERPDRSSDHGRDVFGGIYNPRVCARPKGRRARLGSRKAGKECSSRGRLRWCSPLRKLTAAVEVVRDGIARKGRWGKRACVRAPVSRLDSSSKRTPPPLPQPPEISTSRLFDVAFHCPGGVNLDTWKEKSRTGKPSSRARTLRSLSMARSLARVS